MPRIAKALLQKANAAAVPMLLDRIQGRANKPIPVLCRELSAAMPGKKARTLERSWRNWTNARAGKSTMPEMQTLVSIVRVARGNGWLEGKLPDDIGDLIAAIDEFQKERLIRMRLKLAKLMSGAVVEMGAVCYSVTGRFDVAVEEVLKVCAVTLGESIPVWWDKSDTHAGKKCQAAIDSGIEFAREQLNMAALPIHEWDMEQVKYREWVRSNPNIDGAWGEPPIDEPSTRLGTNWSKIPPTR